MTIKGKLIWGFLGGTKYNWFSHPLEAVHVANLIADLSQAATC